MYARPRPAEDLLARWRALRAKASAEGAPRTTLRYRRRKLLEFENQVVERNMPLAVYVVNKLYQSPGVLGRLAREDAVATAMCALTQAARRFDPSRGVRFSTYATTTITRTVLRAALDGGVVTLPSTALRAGRLTGERAAKAERARVAVALPEEPSLLAALSVGPAEPEDGRWRALLAALPERERTAVEETVVKGRPLRDVGRQMGLSAERVRQIRDRGLEILRGMVGEGNA